MCIYVCDGITLKDIFLKVHRIKIVPSYTVWSSMSRDLSNMNVRFFEKIFSRGIYLWIFDKRLCGIFKKKWAGLTFLVARSNFTNGFIRIFFQFNIEGIKESRNGNFRWCASKNIKFALIGKLIGNWKVI